MLHTATTERPVQTFSEPAAAPQAARVDLYRPIHKALRGFMTDTLGRVGWLDVFDADEMRATLAQLHALLDLCASHLQHENEFVRSAIGVAVDLGRAPAR